MDVPIENGDLLLFHGILMVDQWLYTMNSPSMVNNGDLLLFNGTSKCDLMDYEWDIP